jgi:hypothetical protein
MRKGKNPPKPGTNPHAGSGPAHHPKPISPKVTLSFERYVCGDRFCLSKWNPEQIQSFLDCLRKLSQRTWEQLLASSSKDPALKTGLNPTLYKASDLNGVSWPDWLKRYAKILGIRASDRRRVFGVRIENVFYVLWFDEGHQICKV